MKVLLIDDEERSMRPVASEFRDQEHMVEFRASVDEALQTLKDQRFDLIVIDISMPAGEALRDQNTDGGARTGVALYKKVRETLGPTQKIAIYTNVSGNVAASFGPQDKRYFRFIRKPDVLPFEFVDQMRKFVG
jgi:CheY-like chemotaxis protein